MSALTRGAAGLIAGFAALAGSIGDAKADTTCATYRWHSPPRVVVHDSVYEIGAGAVEAALLHEAVEEVVDELNAVGGIGDAGKVREIEYTTAPFTYGDGRYDHAGSIHVGFTDDIAATAGPGALAETKPYIQERDCRIVEAHVVFPGWEDSYWGDPDDPRWNMRTPQDDAGLYAVDWDRYYSAGERDDVAQRRWFRPTLLHELLHAFGLEHTQWTYAFMNYGTRPWANRGADRSIRPLPDDIGQLRLRYPDDADYHDVSVTNTWFAPDATSAEGAASQKPLCVPSLGTTWSPSTSSSACGLDANGIIGTSVVCPGDRLRARFAVNNGGTDDVDVTYQLFLSTDEQLGNDLAASWHVTSIDDAESRLVSQQFTVPAVASGVTYHPIAKVIAAADSGGSVRSDWIPLRATVRGC